MITESVLIVRSPPRLRERSGQGKRHRGPACARRTLRPQWNVHRVDQAGPAPTSPHHRWNPQGQVLVIPRGAGQDPRCRVEFDDVGKPESDVTAGDLALELAGSALGDQMALVEHGDPVRESI